MSSSNSSVCFKGMKAEMEEHQRRLPYWRLHNARPLQISHFAFKVHMDCVKVRYWMKFQSSVSLFASISKVVQIKTSMNALLNASPTMSLCQTRKKGKEGEREGTRERDIKDVELENAATTKSVIVDQFVRCWCSPQAPLLPSRALSLRHHRRRSTPPSSEPVWAPYCCYSVAFWLGTRWAA